jgi:hypothetical protein
VAAVDRPCIVLRAAQNGDFFAVTVLTLVNANDYIRLHTRAAPPLAALRFTLGSLDESLTGFASANISSAWRSSEGWVPNDGLPDLSGLPSGSLKSE